MYSHYMVSTCFPVVFKRMCLLRKDLFGVRGVFRTPRRIVFTNCRGIFLNPRRVAISNFFDPDSGVISTVVDVVFTVVGFVGNGKRYAACLPDLPWRQVG